MSYEYLTFWSIWIFAHIPSCRRNKSALLALFPPPFFFFCKEHVPLPKQRLLPCRWRGCEGKFNIYVCIWQPQKNPESLFTGELLMRHIGYSSEFERGLKWEWYPQSVQNLTEPCCRASGWGGKASQNPKCNCILLSKANRWCSEGKRLLLLILSGTQKKQGLLY